MTKERLDAIREQAYYATTPLDCRVAMLELLGEIDSEDSDSALIDALSRCSVAVAMEGERLFLEHRRHDDTTFRDKLDLYLMRGKQ